MKKITANGEDLALVLTPRDYVKGEGKRFFSDPSDALQVGSLAFLKGSTVEAHRHLPKPRGDIDPVEVIIVLIGVATASVYDDAGRFVESVMLNVGDMLIQRGGGHGFSFPVRDTVLLEIKCGPYLDRESDKMPLLGVVVND